MIDVHLALFFSAVLFGGLTVIGKFTLHSFPPAFIVTARVAGAALLMHGAALLQGKGRLPRPKTLARLALCSLLGVAFNQYFFLYGLRLTSSISAAVIVTSIPIFTALFSSAMKIERIRRRRVAGIVVALSGVLALFNLTDLSRGGRLAGNLCIVFNCACYAMFLVLSHPIRKELDSMTLSGWFFTLGFLIMLPFGLVSARSLDFSSVSLAGWAGLAYCIVCATMLSYWLNLWALHKAGPTVTALYTYLQPVVAAILALPIVGERLTGREGVAAVLVAAGVYLASTQTRPQPLPEPEPA